MSLPERMATARAELTQIALLLAVTAAFFFVIIPLSVVDPESFGLDQGLPPSFSPRLVAILAAALMGFRIIQLLFMAPSTASEASPEDPAEEFDGVPVRALIGMAAGLLFALVVVPIFGFFIGGAFLLVALLALMGERRGSRLVAFPAIVLALIWGLFGQLLSLRLPPGMLFSD